jgi:hypothetical protein
MDNTSSFLRELVGQEVLIEQFDDCWRILAEHTSLVIYSPVVAMGDCQSARAEVTQVTETEEEAMFDFSTGCRLTVDLRPEVLTGPEAMVMERKDVVIVWP